MIMNRKFFKYAFVAAVVMGAASACGDNVEAGPEDTVRAFYDAVSTGDFAAARELCDTVSMEEYLSRNEERWDAMRQADSSLANIAASILSETGIGFTGTEKEGDRRKVYFVMDAVMGMKKEKVATLKKEGKTWRVEKIIDRK